MARKNPTIDKSTPKDEIVEGLDRLPIAAGTNMKNVEVANAMPEVDMTPNNGDQTDVPTPAFASGKDRRHFESTTRNDPAPGKVGADI